MATRAGVWATRLLLVVVLVGEVALVSITLTPIARCPCYRFILEPDEVARLQELAEANNADAAMRLFRYYAFYDRNYEEGHLWYERAALTDNQVLQGLSEWSCEHTDSVIARMKALGTRGNPKSCLALYRYFRYCECDDQSARIWLERARDLGSPQAQALLDGFAGPVQ